VTANYLDCPTTSATISAITGKIVGAHTLPSRETPMVDPMFRFELHCPHCDQTDMQLIELLADKEEIACRNCGQMIDLTNEQLQHDLREVIESFKEP
jgi:hypothetical protein